MDPTTGLPMGFGKQATSHNNRDAFRPPASDAGFSRGRGRGRGVGGERGRGRGRGRGGFGSGGGHGANGIPVAGVQSATSGTGPANLAETASNPGFNPGVKRPRTAQDKEPPEAGFFKESFCEDPWRHLMQERERQWALQSRQELRS